MTTDELAECVRLIEAALADNLHRLSGDAKTQTENARAALRRLVEG
jgi:hypothetical protein